MISTRTAIVLSTALLIPGLYAATPASSSPAATHVMKKAEPNVRYINTIEAMQGSKKGNEVSKRLEKKRTDLANVIQEKEKQLTQLVNDLKSKQSTLSASARDKEESKIIELRREYESLVQSSEDQLKLAMQRATEELSKEVEEAVTKIALKEGYDVVTDVYTGRTVYASDKVMVTGDLIKVMDIQYEVTAKATPKNASVTA